MTNAEKTGLLCACAVGFGFSANYTNHAPMVPALRAEFQFNQAMAGLLTTGIFLTHALMQVPGGHLADRFGARRVLTAALAVVCLGNFAIGFSTAYWQLLAWKIFVGVGTGTSFVAGARYLAGLVKGPALPVAQGYFGGSILLGSGFVIFAVPQVLHAFGWRGAFFASAAVATAALTAWVALSPSPPAHAHPHTSFLGMLASRQLWLLGLMQMASFGLVIVIGAWITMVLRGGFGSLVLLLGIVMRPLGGALVPRLGARPVLAASMLLTAGGCFLLASAWLKLLAVVLVGTGCGLPYAALFNRAAALYPGRAGAAMGLVNMLGIMMILVGAPLVGQVADWTGSFQSSFVALGVFALVACGAAMAIKES